MYMHVVFDMASLAHDAIELNENNEGIFLVGRLVFEYTTNITHWCSDSATGWRIRVRNPVRRKNFSILQTSRLALAASLLFS
jgi:hypothetical protein